MMEFVLQENTPEPIAPPKAKTKPMPGVLIYVRPGHTISELVRTGLELEVRDGVNIHDAARRLELGYHTYRCAREMVLLVDNPDLGKHDHEICETALRMLDETRRLKAPYAMVLPIRNKVWPKTPKARRNAATAGRRAEAFERSMVVLCQACESSAHIPIPQLHPNKLKTLLRDLKAAHQHMVELTRKLREELRDE
jgi:hypothetical protein